MAGDGGKRKKAGCGRMQRPPRSSRAQEPCPQAGVVVLAVVAAVVLAVVAAAVVVAVAIEEVGVVHREHGGGVCPDPRLGAVGGHDGSCTASAPSESGGLSLPGSEGQEDHQAQSFLAQQGG